MILRQGDVFLFEDAQPVGTGDVVPRDNGRVVLAYGEVTGHAHAIRSPYATLTAAGVLTVTADPGIEQPAGPGDGRLLRLDAYHATVEAWQQGGAQLAWDDVLALRAEGVRVAGDLGWAVVEHEEHLPIVLRPGVYRVQRQREYTPEAIRNVAD